MGNEHPCFMFRRIADNLRRFDWILFAGVFALYALGLAAIYSVSLSHDPPDFNDFHKQIIFGIIGFAMAWLAGVSRSSGWRVYGRIIYILTIIMLFAVLLFGTTINGTRGWFSFGGLGVQPVELAKIAMVIVLAKFFSNRLQRFQSGKHVIVSAFICLSFVFLVMLQPDFGSALVLLGTWFIMLILTGMSRRVIAIILVILILLSLVAWLFVLQDYQKERVAVFLNPAADPLGSGYNVSQALIAIGSGRFFGRGLGFGSQSQLKFIPEAQTDFIFAVIAEELGFFGVALVIVCWGVIFYRLLRVARRAPDDFGLFVVLGIMSIFFIHLVVNVGMNMGLLPVMGISLPFISYGGSFLVSSLIMLGIAQSVRIDGSTDRGEHGFNG